MVALHMVGWFSRDSMHLHHPDPRHNSVYRKMFVLCFDMFSSNTPWGFLPMALHQDHSISLWYLNKIMVFKIIIVINTLKNYTFLNNWNHNIKILCFSISSSVSVSFPFNHLSFIEVLDSLCLISIEPKNKINFWFCNT